MGATHAENGGRRAKKRAFLAQAMQDAFDRGQGHVARSLLVVSVLFLRHLVSLHPYSGEYDVHVALRAGVG